MLASALWTAVTIGTSSRTFWSFRSNVAERSYQGRLGGLSLLYGLLSKPPRPSPRLHRSRSQSRLERPRLPPVLHSSNRQRDFSGCAITSLSRRYVPSHPISLPRRVPALPAQLRYCLRDSSVSNRSGLRHSQLPAAGTGTLSALYNSGRASVPTGVAGEPQCHHSYSTYHRC